MKNLFSTFLLLLFSINLIAQIGLPEVRDLAVENFTCQIVSELEKPAFQFTKN